MEEHRCYNLNKSVVTVEGGITWSIDCFDIFDIFSGSLISGGFEFFFSLGPYSAFVDC